MKDKRYETIDDLADVLKNVLPVKAQEIYLETYQESWDNYEDWKGGEMGREGVAHRNAMQAVMREYVLDEESGTWHKKGEKVSEEESEQNLLDRAIDFLEDMMSSGEKLGESQEEGK